MGSLPQSLLDEGPRPGRLKQEEETCKRCLRVSAWAAVCRRTTPCRSLRNTAGRRAAQCEEMRRVEAGKKMLADMAETTRRCDRGRLPSDSSSGISDDASSSGSGSDRDSGIETGDIGAVGSWGHCVTGAGVPVSYGLDQETDRMMATADREKIREVLETG